MIAYESEGAGATQTLKRHVASTARPKNAGRTASNREICFSEPNRTEPIRSDPNRTDEFSKSPEPKRIEPNRLLPEILVDTGSWVTC